MCFFTLYRRIRPRVYGVTSAGHLTRQNEKPETHRDPRRRSHRASGGMRMEGDGQKLRGPPRGAPSPQTDYPPHSPEGQRRLSLAAHSR